MVGEDEKKSPSEIMDILSRTSTELAFQNDTKLYAIRYIRVVYFYVESVKHY